MEIFRPEGRSSSYGIVGSIRPPLDVVPVSGPLLPHRAAWCGARIVNRIPSRARISSVSRSTAVSGSHMPSGGRPKRCLKSRIPQRTCVCLSRALASGRIMWL